MAFCNDIVDTIAKDFTSEVDEWRVIVDDTAPSKFYVLAQLAKKIFFRPFKPKRIFFIKYKKGWHILRVTMMDDHIECYYCPKRFLG